MLRESLIMAWENIKNNKMRAFLTILGIVIGVCAIIALITTVSGVIDDVNRQFDNVGANTVIVQAHGTAIKQGLNEKDLATIGKIDGVDGYSPTVSTVLDVYNGGEIFEDVTIDGKNEEYFRRNPDLIKEGRPINILDIENRNRVCVISRKMQKKMFPGERALGRDIKIGGVRYRVVGVTDDSDALNSVMTVMSGVSDSIMLPYTNVMRMADIKNISALEVYMKDTGNPDVIVAQIKKELDAAFNFKDDSYTVIEMDSLLDMMKSMQSMMQTMLVGIASIALLVGGIGIMNMMLVSVTERTTEIGLRKALGAEPKRIRFQFLTEAIVLSILGGIIGTILGLAISLGCSIAMSIDFTVSWSAIAIGVGFSGAVGIIFGYAPARKASELNPIDALRSV
ncbi:MAG: ABC transporter permease [Clostridia bacterium]